MISCHLACVTDDIKSPPVVWISLQGGFIKVQQNLHLFERFCRSNVKDQKSSDRSHELDIAIKVYITCHDIGKDESVIIGLLAVLFVEDFLKQLQGYLKLDLFSDFFVILSTEMSLYPLSTMQGILSEIVDLHPQFCFLARFY